MIPGCALLLAGALTAAATTPVPASAPRPLEHYTIEQWDTASGLPHNTVQSITQTRDGYLWLGTWEGLVRYNGREMRVFDRSNTPALGDNGIRVLHAARDGALWIGTARSGVVQRLGATWRRFGVDDGLPTGQTEALAEDAEGNIYVSSTGVTLARIAPDGRVRTFSLRSGAAAASSGTGIAIDAEGAVWVGSSLGLLVLRDDVLEHAPLPESVQGGSVSAVGIDARHQVLAVAGNLLLRRSGDDWVTLATLADNIGRTVEAIHANARGEIFLGTQSSGLLRWWNGHVETIDASRGFPNNRVPAVFEDRERSLWVGTNAGLTRLRETMFATYTERKGLSDNYVRSLVERRDGSLWVGTSRGLNRIGDGRIEALFRRDGLASDAVLSLMEDRDGVLWVGSYDAGLTLLHAERPPQHIGVRDGLPAPQVRALLQTRDGTVWAGGPRGLVRIRDGVPEPVELDASVPNRFVLSLYEDRAGMLWVGTVQGVARVVQGRLERWDGGPAFRAQDVFDFHEDAAGALWIAGDDALYRVRDGAVVRLDETQGLPHVPVFRILDDGLGRLWLTSNRGVFRIETRALGALADGVRAHGEFEAFRESSGLGSSQFSGAAMSPALRRRDGSLWFATAKGVAVVDPSAPAPEPPGPPPVVIEQVLVDGHLVDTGTATRLQLGPGARKLEIHYAGLSFVLPNQIRYRVMLEGFDGGWDLIGSNASVVYTALPPGEYRFRAEADDGSGAWAGPGAYLRLQLQPHLWERSWFPLLVLVTLAVIGYWLSRARLSHLQTRTEALEREVAVRTHSLREQAERLSQADAEKGHLLARLQVQAAALARQAREDALTGLPNRRSLDEALNRHYSNARAGGVPLSVAIADIDHFKRINDNHSHEAGDTVLRDVGRLLREGIRDQDVVGRYGGEEFLLLFPGLSVDEAATLCERLRRRVAEFDFGARYPGLGVTVSIGVADRAVRPGHQGLLSAADTMLYEAKHAGRNRVCWRGGIGQSTDAPVGVVS